MKDSKSIKQAKIQNPYHHRINFLYQATKYLAESDDERLKNISKYYADTMKEVQRKSLAKIDPSIKRTICKKCHKYISPKSNNAKIQWKSKCKRSYLVVKCNQCANVRYFVANCVQKE